MTRTESPHGLPAPSDRASCQGDLDFNTLPPLYQDRSFWGMTATQFLGAFNDSVFKQIVLLVCLSVVVVGASQPSDQQFLAQGVFAIAFILFSGISGYWSDRVRKRTLVVGCKVLEVLVMLAAAWTFLIMSAPKAATKVTVVGELRIENTVYVTSGMPWPLLAVLFAMGLQSAIFGPAKYGILPEMVRGGDLPRFNGMIQMTTFLALVFGPWVGGLLLDRFHAELWKAGAVCVAIALVGTTSSVFVRRTPVAQPNAPLRISALVAGSETWSLFRKDRSLRLALFVYSVFWFVAALLPMIINWLGVYQFHLNYADTSFLFSVTSIGIAGGFVLAGWLSAERVRFGLVRYGAWGLILCLLLMSLPASFSTAPAATPEPPAAAAPGNRGGSDGTADVSTAPIVKDAINSSSWHQLLRLRGSQLVLIFMGFFAGLFALPVQVFLQSSPPTHLKGRVIGAMNLINWIAIIFAAVFYFAADSLLGHFELPKFLTFGLAALFLLPIALFYRPSDVEL